MVAGVAETGPESLPLGGAGGEGFDEESLLCLVMQCDTLADIGVVQLLDKGLISRGQGFFRAESRSTTGRSMI